MNNKYNYTFQRLEKKYKATEDQIQKLLSRLSSYIQMDDYGQSTICNIYYDTEDNLLIRRSIEKPVYKEKMRLRSYGVPNKNGTVFLELKKKYDGIVYKRRVDLTLQEASYYLNNGIKPKGNTQRFKELDYFMEFYHPFPKLYIAYERTAYTCPSDPALRLTIDRNIRSRSEDLYLEDGDEGTLLLPEDTCIMEIKTQDAMPIWLARALSELEIYPASFSKYGKIYEKNRKRVHTHTITEIKENVSCSTAS